MRRVEERAGDLSPVSASSNAASSIMSPRAMLISHALGFIAASSAAPIIALVASVEGAARITQSNSPSFACHASGVSVPSRPDRVTPVTVDPERRQSLADQLADRAHPDDQRAGFEQFDLARRVLGPFVPVVRARPTSS